MPLPVSLDEVASEMNLQSDLVRAYINKATGEVISITDEEKRLAERGDDDVDVSGWMRDVLPKVREVMESESFLALPSKRDIHEYKIMEAFCESVEPDEQRAQLLDAIRGKGAFSRFRRTSERLGVRHDWYSYRDAALRRKAARWLNAHGIPYFEENGETPL
jgi:hypothetical protein